MRDNIYVVWTLKWRRYILKMMAMIAAAVAENLAGMAASKRISRANRPCVWRVLLKKLLMMMTTTTKTSIILHTMVPVAFEMV